jgi:adenylate kinase family enzyme
MTDASIYFDRKQIPQLLECLVTALSFHQPDDPLDYLIDCLGKLKKSEGNYKYDHFIKTSEDRRLSRGGQRSSLGQIRSSSAGSFSSDGGKTSIATPPLKNGIAGGMLVSGKKILPQINEVKKKSVDEKNGGIIETTNERVDDAHDIFPSSNLNVVFCLGGPGSGKGTNCSRLAKEFGYNHISVGDILRMEAQKDTPEGKEIDALMKEGKIVPIQHTLRALKAALKKTYLEDKDKIILLDGFPREMSQVHEFENQIGKCKFVLFFDCPEETLEQRLLERGKTSGRIDDNMESIKKRFHTFKEQSYPVVQWFEKENRLVKISSAPPPDEVYEQVKKNFS